MKIKETAKGNIQITMSKKKANSLHELLDCLHLSDYERSVEQPDDITELRNFLADNYQIL